MPIIETADVLNRIVFLQDGKSLADFCQNAGLNYENIRKCFQRNSLPDAESLSKIAGHFRLDLHWLVSGTAPRSEMSRNISKKITAFRISRAWTPATLAAQLSITPRVLQLYEEGKCMISSDLLQDFSRALGVPPHAFVTNEALPAASPQLKIFGTASTETGPQISGEDFVSVPLTESVIAAGQPIIPQEHIEDYVLLHIRAAAKRTNLVASRVDGHSMEPMLHPGDIVVIDRDDKTIVKNRMFAIYHEGGLTAKYLELKNHLLILRPINPNAEIQIIDLNENPQPVVGRIIGAWKDL